MSAVKKKENRIVTPVNRSNMERFRDFISPEAMDLLSVPGGFGLGVLVSDGERFRSAGVLIFFVKEERNPAKKARGAAKGAGGAANDPRGGTKIFLQWLYVGEAFRGQGIADFLMEAFFDSISDTGQVFVAIPADGAYDGLYLFLQGWGFSFRLQYTFLFQATLGELRKSKSLQKLKKIPGAKPLKELSPIQRKELGRWISGRDVPADLKRYDEHLSCFLEEGDEILAVFLTEGMNSGLYVPFLLDRLPATTKKVSVAPLLAYLYRETESLPEDTPMQMLCRTEKSGQILDAFFPDIKPVLTRSGVFVRGEEKQKP